MSEYRVPNTEYRAPSAEASDGVEAGGAVQPRRGQSQSAPADGGPGGATPPRPLAGEAGAARARYRLPAHVPTAVQFALGAVTFLIALAVWHVLTPAAEAPLAFDYLPRPFAPGATTFLPPHPDPLPGGEGANSRSPWERVGVRGLPVRTDADAAQARGAVEAFVAALSRANYAAAWQVFDPEARAVADEAAWRTEQQIWDAAGPAPGLSLGDVVAYPLAAAAATGATNPTAGAPSRAPLPGTQLSTVPDRLAVLVQSDAIAAAEAERGRGAFPPLAFEVVRRDGQWYLVKPASLWAGGSPLALRPADRAGLGWLRYPLRVAPLPDDLALLARVAALPAQPGTRLLDLTVDERPLASVENPGYDPAQLAPGVRAVWAVESGTTITRQAAQTSWGDALRAAGWESIASPLRLRLFNAAGSGSLDTLPINPDGVPAGGGSAAVQRLALHVTEARGEIPDRERALAFRREVARRGALADAAVADLPVPPGARLLTGPAEPAATIASAEGQVDEVWFVYPVDRGGRTPTEIRSFYGAQLTGAGWARVAGAGDFGFQLPSGAGRLYVTGFDDTPLRQLVGFSLHPARYVLVVATARTN